MNPQEKQLTPEQERDRKLAESLRAPLSFAVQSPITMANSTPAIMAQPRPIQSSTPSIFTNISNVVNKGMQSIASKTPEPLLKYGERFGKNMAANFSTNIAPEKIGEQALNFTPIGMAKAVKPILNTVIKETPPAFKGLKDLSTSIVEKLKGRTTVSKQFISDLTKGAEVKLSEKNIINNVLESSPDNISVADFAKKVQDELLPLKRSKISSPRYENTSLPEQLRGDIDEYSERIYSSPIKTSAGEIHFAPEGVYDAEAGAMSYPKRGPKAADNYFGHTRVEDMADNQTRRVIEVQSDLYQKGNLEREKGNIWAYMKPEESPLMLGRTKTDALYAKRDADMLKLQQYNDPTAHYRMIREEIKKAAKDGKTKLQFPTGETAMKIEGLGETQQWMHDVPDLKYKGATNSEILAPNNLKIGKEIIQGTGTQSPRWIITNVLGDGKFKAVPKNKVQSLQNTHGSNQEAFNDALDDFAEQFDISGKVDTNNPIYKFYDKEVRKFLNKFGGKEVVDDKGVSWIEIPITKEQAKEPVQAFGKIGIKPLLKGAGASALFTAITNTEDTVSYKKEEPQYSNQQIRDSIGINETQGIENPYSFRKFSGSIKMGEDLGKYQVTTENLRLYGERYLGKKVSVKEFLASPQLQDKYAEAFINEMQTKYKATPEQILEMWRGGLNADPNKSSVKQYKEKGMKNLESMLQSNNKTS